MMVRLEELNAFGSNGFNADDTSAIAAEASDPTEMPLLHAKCKGAVFGGTVGSGKNTALQLTLVLQSRPLGAS